MSYRPRKRPCGKQNTSAQIFHELRQVQNITHCSTKTLDLILQRLHPFLKGCEDVKQLKMPRVRARKKSIFKQQLHGCTGCDAYVFGPENVETRCPHCGYSRYTNGKPREVCLSAYFFVFTYLFILFIMTCMQVCWFFPLQAQIRQLLRIGNYMNLLLYEREHRSYKKGESYMSDIYDSTRWQRVAGQLYKHRRLARIVLHMCVDGVEASEHGRQEFGSTMKPIQYFIANLPPWLRYKLSYMLVHALIPAHLKGKAAKKYYDWLGRHEMTQLYRDGVEGVRVIVYGNTLDTPGRREILNMQAVTAFYPCPHCIHSWQPGLRGQVYCGYRRFLPPNHPWRQTRFTFMGLTYQFKDAEARDPPRLRRDDNVKTMIARAVPTRPFLGHKGPHFLSEWEGFDWDGNFCDKMHDYKLFCEMLLKCLVGTNSSHDMYKAWATKRKDYFHRQDCRAYQIFEEFCSDDDSPPPWRLSKQEVVMCDLRVRSIWWPHDMDPPCYGDHSFWTHSDRIWKAKHKGYVFTCLLPTCLYRCCVPEVHTALLMLVSALRSLEGQVICLAEAKRRLFVPGLVCPNLSFLVRPNLCF